MVGWYNDIIQIGHWNLIPSPTKHILSINKSEVFKISTSNSGWLNWYQSEIDVDSECDSNFWGGTEYNKWLWIS